MEGTMWGGGGRYNKGGAIKEEESGVGECVSR